MKQIILTIAIISCATAYGQTSPRDSLKQEVNSYIKTVTIAASQFLNRKLSTAERIKAIEPYAIIYDDKQKDQFKNTVLDNEEQPEIRAMALNKIYDVASDDQRLYALVVEWLRNPRAPKVLRQEALHLIGTLSFFSIMDVPDVYQKMLEDPEPEFRVFAFTKLILHGDARAQQKLIAGLEDPGSALVPAPTAIGILSMSLKKEYYPAVYKVLQQTKDDATRLEAIRALGFYTTAREMLIAISRNANEKEAFREAALGALYGGDRDNIVVYTSPILLDKSATPRLQAIAIQMSIDIRQSMSFRAKAKRADPYDILVKNIAEGNGVLQSPELQQVANRYIQTVRPKY